MNLAFKVCQAGRVVRRREGMGEENDNSHITRGGLL